MRYLTVVFCALAISANANVESVSGLGGLPKDNAAAIQRAIDDVAAAGGGRVTVPSGTWTTGTIYLKSHVELHLPEGTRLVGSSDLDDYNPLDAFPQNYGSVSEGWSARHLILALEQTDVAITGSGVIDGNGKAFFGEKPEVFGETWWREGGINARDRERQGRPGQLIEFVECRGVRVEGVRIEDSPCWSCFFYGCDDVVVRGLRIDNPPRHLNTDGIDIDSCRRVSVRDCAISTGDDAIAIRCAAAHLKDPARICEDVSIENCTLGSSADGIRIGVGTGTIRNVRISDVEINRAGTAFHVQSVFGKSSGVDILNIRFSNSRIRGAARAFEIVGTFERRPRDIIVSHVSVEDSKLVEHSFSLIENADAVRFWDVDKLRPGEGVPRHFTLDVETGNALHVLSPGQRPVIVMRNGCEHPQNLDVRLRLVDFYGHGFDIPCRQRLVQGGETLRKTLPPPDRMGHWRLTGEFRSKDSCMTTTCDFAVLEPRKDTPAWGADEFRFGVNSHLPWYPEDVRKHCLDALVAVGAKLMRTDMFAPSDICPRAGEWNWSEHEGILRTLEERGIALHAIIYGCPRWACARGDERHRHGITCPMRSGLYESYCRMLASRYGTRIAFYEIGNEWDMTPASRLPDDAAITMQVEAMRGLHAGCSNVVCVANGWASPPTAPASERRVGLHRRLIGEHPDAYDVYAIHCHGLFRWYEPAIREALAFLKEKGIDKPWYSDESALSSSDGKEVESARTVWKKCLFAWSYGSVGHVWYNLRATGKDPKNEEHGYGLFTMDFHPRPSAAAYSAMTSLFARLKPNAILTDDPGLFVARWRGRRDGRSVSVFAGWCKTPGKTMDGRIPVSGKRAWRVDLMGNRTMVPILEGSVACVWTEEPSAVLVDEQ